MGDFNYTDINWATNNVVSGKGSEFLEVIQDCFLHQMVNERTRDGAVLDLVFTSDEDKIRDLTVGEHLGESDHRNIRFRINFQHTAVCNTRIIPNFKRANFQIIRDELKEAFGKGLKEVRSCQQWEEFKGVLNRVIMEVGR